MTSAHSLSDLANRGCMGLVSFWNRRKRRNPYGFICGRWAVATIPKPVRHLQAMRIVHVLIKFAMMRI